MLMKKSKSVIGEAYIVISAILFGLMPLLSKIAYQHGSNPYTVAFGRFAIGSFVLFIFVWLIPDCHIFITKKQVVEFIKLSVFYGAMPIFLYESYDLIDTGLATTLHFIYPVVVIIISAVFCKTALNKKQIACTIICMVGISSLYTPKGSVAIMGIFLAGISGVVYAMYIVLLGRSQIQQLHPFVISFWVAFFAAIEIGITGLVTNHLTFCLDATAWISECLLAILTTGIALVLFQRGVFLCGDIKASLLSAFEPITGIMIGILIFQEKIAIKEVIGIILIIISALVLVLDKREMDSSKVKK